MKYWWARVGSGKGYGSWMPTGHTDKELAIDYLKTHCQDPPVKEWMLL